jgi:hemoglobin
MQSVYDAAGGHDGILRLAEAWHRRVLADEVVSHAFSHGFKGDHTPRLAAYLEEALGGPPTYTDTYGDETDVVRIHSGDGEHTDMDNRAIRCWDEALGDVGLDADAGLGRAVHDYFAWATRATMSRYPDSPDDVPDGLTLRHWSWEGLVPGPDEWSSAED